MRKFSIRSVAFLAILFSVGAASANEVYETYGWGVNWGQARNDARAQGRQLCLSNGYPGGTFEEVQTYPSGGGYITYGITYCW